MSEKFEAEVLKMFGKIDSRLGNIENTLDEHTEILNEHSEKLDEHSKLIRKNTEEIKGLTEVVQSHTNTLIKFDHDFNQKIDVLFDTFEYLDHEYLANKVATDNYKRKSFQQEVRISALENLLKNNPKVTTA